MTVTKTPLDGLLFVEPRVFADDRGFFFESFNARDFARDTGISSEFLQDNHSHSRQGVVRGLHYQIQQPQGKLVRAVRGRIFDVAVDIRRSSPTFGKWYGTELSEDNHAMLWVPAGFAHGFATLSDYADVLYKTTDYWAPQHERTVVWDDAQIAIDWHLTGPAILSAKDQAGTLLVAAEVFP
jgi:dTDP-4-dehydrorhamnose 3,5-epimerase